MKTVYYTPQLYSLWWTTIFFNPKANKPVYYSTEVSEKTIETENHWQLAFTIPNMRKRNWRVTMEDNYILVEANSGKQTLWNRLFRKNTEHKTFEKRIQLNERINKEDISAKFKKGTLNIYLPKVQPGSTKINVV